MFNKNVCGSAVDRFSANGRTGRNIMQTTEGLMSSVKEEMTRIIQAQPDDSSFDEILRELALARMIDRGLQDSDAGRTISDDELRRQMSQWRK